METIKFIRKHSTGITNHTPNKGFCFDICNGSGQRIATIDIKEDVNLFCAAPEMAGYLIKRAEKLHSIFFNEDIMSIDHAKRCYKEEYEDLQEIIGMLEKAGVEVAYE